MHRFVTDNNSSQPYACIYTVRAHPTAMLVAVRCRVLFSCMQRRCSTLKFCHGATHPHFALCMQKPTCMGVLVIMYGHQPKCAISDVQACTDTDENCHRKCRALRLQRLRVRMRRDRANRTAVTVATGGDRRHHIPL